MHVVYYCICHLYHSYGYGQRCAYLPNKNANESELIGLWNNHSSDTIIILKKYLHIDHVRHRTLLVNFPRMQIPGVRGGGRGGHSYMKKSEMFSLRGTSQGFWSHLRCWWRNVTILSCQSIFYGAGSKKYFRSPAASRVRSGLLARAPFLNSDW